MEKMSLRSEELKHRWDSTNLRFERDRTYDLSWPQRNYHCSFCNKQFKSAQALGGHMNVHRRDRARLRQSTHPLDCPNSNPSPIIPTSSPNPSPNFSSSPSVSRFFPYISHYSSLTSSLSSFSSNPSASSAVDETKLLFKDHCDQLGGNFYEVGKMKSSMNKEDPFGVLKKNESVVRCGFNMGLQKDVKEESSIDLELRLGYS